MKRIKILHLVEDLKIGGLERVIESIVTGLDKDRYNAEVWCLAHGGEIAEDLIEKGIIVKTCVCFCLNNLEMGLFYVRI